ncbi:TetR/AcrR family transcriptional regulator [Phreatobacter sp. AB_2022a]|uniref:TetR/AcrR family transcriptional regulator n=1 Tax=Phreatobacter sp. AB_2022a TaxID=3003134 RepID=UPI0022876969|nr:TetR/AcrR family transcriptional regulator [Phreatobacter sp. AB_2022a]MCZ0736652.1 helix-turn-helix domain containing protein [Phreatobacter sp. AB_2022a]
MEERLAGVRQFDEAAMLEEALALFWRQGAAATSMLDVAAATGVQRGSLYNAYGDKEAIFLRAFDLYAARFLDGARASLEGDDAGPVLRRFFDTVIANMTSGTPARGCLTTKTAGDGSLASERIRDKLGGFLDRLAAVVEAALSRPAVRAGLALEPAQAAMVVVTFTRGLAVMERVHGDPAALTRAAEGLIRALVR